MPVVYALSLESTPYDYRYVGITKFNDPYLRLKGHIKKAKQGASTHSSNWIRKSIKDGEKILCTILAYNESYEECIKMEKRFIQLYRKNGINLTNMTDGGEGSLGHYPSKETTAKRSNTLRKVLSDLLIRKKMSEGNKGKVLSLETKVKIGMAHRGKIVSEETRIKLSESHKGRRHSAETKEKMSQAHLRRQKQLKQEKASK